MTQEVLRLDKWLWRGRFFKSRSLASRVCTSGGVRIDGVRVHKAHLTVRPGQVITFPQGRRIRVVRIVDLGIRRGPAKEAALLFQDLSDEAPIPRIVTVAPVVKPV